VHVKEQAVFVPKQYNLPLTDTPGANLTQQRVSTYSAQLLQMENESKSQAAYESAKNSPMRFPFGRAKRRRIVKLRGKIWS
jgi:hypothetical protein